MPGYSTGKLRTLRLFAVSARNQRPERKRQRGVRGRLRLQGGTTKGGWVWQRTAWKEDELRQGRTGQDNERGGTGSDRLRRGMDSDRQRALKAAERFAMER